MIKSISVGLKNCERLFPIVKKAGFDGVDLGLDDDKSFFEGDLVENTEKLKQLFLDNDLVCAQVHLPFYGIFTSSEIYDEEMENRIKKSFYVMKALGAKWGAFHAQSSSNFEYDRKRAMHDNKEKLKNYLEEAEKYDVGIAVENIPVFPDCPQYDFFSSNIDDHIELVDSMNSDLVKVCWDFGHSNLMNYDIIDVLKKMGDRIKIVHMHNNNGMCDWHVTPSIGTIEWDGIIDVLKKFNFDGPINIETNLKLCQLEECKRYVDYIFEDARWIEKKFVGI